MNEPKDPEENPDEILPAVKKFSYCFSTATTVVLLGTVGYFFGKTGGETHSFNVALVWGFDGAIMGFIRELYQPIPEGWLPRPKVLILQLIAIACFLSLYPIAGIGVTVGCQLIVCGILVYLLEENGFFDWKFGNTTQLPKVMK